MGVLKELYEISKKKNKKLQKKLNSETFVGKLKMLYFVILFMFNVYFLVKCKC